MLSESVPAGPLGKGRRAPHRASMQIAFGAPWTRLGLIGARATSSYCSRRPELVQAAKGSCEFHGLCAAAAGRPKDHLVRSGRRGSVGAAHPRAAAQQPHCRQKCDAGRTPAPSSHPYPAHASDRRRNLDYAMS
ncbi:hypothetical protein M8818_007322 [Zalaria obscura]|uniref:Uncharacterized protein n=1 Tax=Zalaria obscura TaxID=2024903 RepID=A0ACC3S410_9PEZI